jgi:hypothetical protein
MAKVVAVRGTWVIEGPAASLGIEDSMTYNTYTRCARTALQVGDAGQASIAFGSASQAMPRATTARAPEKEISFAEAVSAQAAPGEGTQ